MNVKCAYCGKKCEKSLGHYNRAIKIKAKLFCGQRCFGLNRRLKITDAEKKRLKAEYDREYREKNEKRLKKGRHEWFVKDYAANPEKYKKERQRKQKAHNEYCRRPAYKKRKKKYDQQYRAKKLYGKYWESSVALRQLADVVDNRQAKRDQKIFNKSQKRKRNANKNTQRKELESCSVGLYQPS